MARRLIDEDDDTAREAAIAVLVAEVRTSGDRWLSDEWDFVQVTLATQAVKRRLAALEVPARCPSPGRVLVSAMPGDQHDFGVRLLGLRLREAGWDVIDDAPADDDALVRVVAVERPDAVCLSVGHDRVIAPAGALVERLRRAAGRRGLCVALGGAMLNGDPDTAYALGADVHADDAGQLVTLLAGRMLVPA